MTDPHRVTVTTIRLPADLKARLVEVLAQQGWELNEWAVSSAVATTSNTEGYFRSLSKYRRSAKRGRPKAPDGETADP